MTAADGARDQQLAAELAFEQSYERGLSGLGWWLRWVGLSVRDYRIQRDWFIAGYEAGRNAALAAAGSEGRHA